jgi:S1-C subfamily serine protease
VACVALNAKEKEQSRLRPLLGVDSMRANYAGVITRKSKHTFYRNAHICAFAGCVVAFLMASITYHSSRVNATKLADLRAMQIDVRRIDGDTAYEYDFASNCLVKRQIVKSDLGDWGLLRTNTDELVVDSSDYVVVMGADDRIYCT